MMRIGMSEEKEVFLNKIEKAYKRRAVVKGEKEMIGN